MQVTASKTITKPINKVKRTHRYPIRYWTEDEKKQILELHNAGFTDQEIGKNFNARSHQIHMVIINYKNKLAGLKW